MRYTWTTATRPTVPYEGQSGYNSTDGVVEWYDGTRWVQADTVVRIQVKNTSGVTLAKGAPVYATGSVGASGEVEVALANASSSATMPAIGLLEEELVANAEGEAIVIGTLFEVDTSAYAINGSVYVAVGGGLTPTRPTGATELVQNIGRVTRVHATTGIIVVMGPARTNDTPNAISARTVALNGTTSGTVTIQPAAAAGTWSLTLPTTDGNSGEFLQTDGSGVTTWAAATAGAGGSDTQVQFNSSGVLAGDAGLTYNAATNTLTTDVAQLGAAGATTGELKMSGATSGTVTIKPANAAGTYTLTLPTDDGNANQVLRTDGSGVLSWNGAPPGGSSGQVQYNASGTLSGDAGLTYDAANDTLSTKKLTLGTAGSALGEVTLSGSTSGTVTIKPAAAAGTYSLTLPTTDGNASEFLQTDGSGVLTWATPTAAAGGSTTQVQYNSAGALAGDAGLTYDAANDTLSTKIVQLGTAGSALGQLKLSGNTSGTVTVQTAAAAGTYTLTLPTTDGNSNEVLRTDGSGVLSWVSRDLWTYAKLTSDFSTTSGSQTNVTGLSFTPAANTEYEIEVKLLLESSVNGNAVRPGNTWPTGYSGGAGMFQITLGGFTTNISTGFDAASNTAGTALANTGTAWGAAAANLPYITVGAWILRMGASPSGNFQITVASETGGTTVRVKTGSFLKYRTI